MIMVNYQFKKMNSHLDCASSGVIRRGRGHSHKNKRMRILLRNGFRGINIFNKQWTYALKIYGMYVNQKLYSTKSHCLHFITIIIPIIYVTQLIAQPSSKQMYIVDFCLIPLKVRQFKENIFRIFFLLILNTDFNSLKVIIQLLGKALWKFGHAEGIPEI